MAEKVEKVETRGRKKIYLTPELRKESKKVLNKQSYIRVKDKTHKIIDLSKKFIDIMNDRKMKKYSKVSDFENDLYNLQNEILSAF
jgi:hypothetical protein